MGLLTGEFQLAGDGTTQIAFRHPTFGTAFLVGVAVVTLLHGLLADDDVRVRAREARSSSR
ncbi:hypothetical protein ABZ446_21030 [Streptomyces sp. NPDC005813]|uniref:hypothetical protein n=1 Tax=Streptomyces sp. NPDC005813 TaxID=3155592 RepID=UPI0033FDCF42